MQSTISAMEAPLANPDEKMIDLAGDFRRQLEAEFPDSVEATRLLQIKLFVSYKINAKLGIHQSDPRLPNFQASDANLATQLIDVASLWKENQNNKNLDDKKYDEKRRDRIAETALRIMYRIPLPGSFYTDGLFLKRSQCMFKECTNKRGPAGGHIPRTSETIIKFMSEQLQPAFAEEFKKNYVITNEMSHRVKWTKLYQLYYDVKPQKPRTSEEKAAEKKFVLSTLHKCFCISEKANVLEFKGVKFDPQAAALLSTRLEESKSHLVEIESIVQQSLQQSPRVETESLVQQSAQEPVVKIEPNDTYTQFSASNSSSGGLHSNDIQETLENLDELKVEKLVCRTMTTEDGYVFNEDGAKLEVRPSTFVQHHGKYQDGLFLSEKNQGGTVGKGTILTWYIGNVHFSKRTVNDILVKFDNQPASWYFFDVEDPDSRKIKYYIDGFVPDSCYGGNMRCLGTYINHDGDNPNTEFVVLKVSDPSHIVVENKCLYRAAIRACRDIVPGEELTLHYGKKYHQSLVEKGLLCKLVGVSPSLKTTVRVPHAKRKHTASTKRKQSSNKRFKNEELKVDNVEEEMKIVCKNCGESKTLKGSKYCFSCEMNRGVLKCLFKIVAASKK